LFVDFVVFCVFQIVPWPVIVSIYVVFSLVFLVFVVPLVVPVVSFAQVVVYSNGMFIHIIFNIMHI
jgi:hypothetical protein